MAAEAGSYLLTLSPKSVAVPIDIARQFQLPSQPEEVTPFGSGHINDTFLVQTSGGNKFLLQRINTEVFRDPQSLMENFSRVTHHVRSRMVDMGISNLERRSLQLVPTQQGALFFSAEGGAAWRMMNYVNGTHAVDFVTDPRQAYEAAHAFGIFQRCLWDMDPGQVSDTIPGFHDIGWRFRQLREAVKEGLPGRLLQAQAEVEQALSYEVLTKPVLEAWQAGALPRRVTHNDTKLNNVLLDDETGEGLCVIDLDTVMAGTVLFDFGDMIRTFSSPVAEDDPDLTKVSCRLDVFEALAKGYLGVLKGYLSPEEADGLVLGGTYMTLIMAIRFLADFLRGDLYYKTRHPLHNLHRCRNQLALIRDLQNSRAEMENMVKRLLC